MTQRRTFPSLILIAPGTNAQSSYHPLAVAAFYDGIEYPREIYSGAGVYDDGAPFATLTFKVYEAADFVTDMTRIGVYTAKFANVTIRLPDDSRIGYADWNGQALQPKKKRDITWAMFRYAPVVLVVRKLKAAS